MQSKTHGPLTAGPEQDQGKPQTRAALGAEQQVPKPTCPGRPIPPGLIWWSPQRSRLMLPCPATRWPSSDRYRQVPLQQRRRQKATSTGVSQPASPAKQQALPSPCRCPHQKQQKQRKKSAGPVAAAAAAAAESKEEWKGKGKGLLPCCPLQTGQAQSCSGVPRLVSGLFTKKPA
ncbi:hypothetical protein CFIO01_03834 [Colletotrichum fioriniae PJ7]|uniref:Uncharacterized protein n=1 Tax=Colletotrichum fioriniae PJ7 TaxID=1445577 RepID=A0A010QYI2_9PEZI|nr:hypothetical protein CFIO01_03834 [Colletotrichum fioriniae PJ7]